MLLILGLSIGLPVILSLIFTPLAGKLAVLVGAIDMPDARKVHKKPIPRMGGMAVFLSFILSAGVVYLLFPSAFPAGIRVLPHFLILLDSTVAVVIIGICDDVWTLKPGQKFAVQVIAGTLVYMAGYRIVDVTNPFGSGMLNLGLLGYPVTVLWVVGITNSFNLIDGLDGLAAGVAFISGLTILGISILNGYYDTAIFAALLIGSVLGFLQYNFNPAKIFLGDSGSLFLGFMLSVLSIRSSIKGSTAFSIIVPLLALGLPVMDTLLAMTRRFMRSMVDQNSDSMKKRLHSLFLPDRRHIHHQLLANGLSHRDAVLILYTISSGFGLCAFLVTISSLNTSLILMLTGLATIFMVRKLGYREMQFLGNGLLLRLYKRTLLKGKSLQYSLDVLSVILSLIVAMVSTTGAGLHVFLEMPVLFSIVTVCTLQLTVLFIGRVQKVDTTLLAVGDLMRITKYVLISVALSAPVLAFFSIAGLDGHLTTTVLLDFYFLGTLIVGSRVSFHILNHLSRKQAEIGKRILIYGADSSGLLVLQSLLARTTEKVIPVGFIDDNPEMEGKFIDDYPIFGGHWRLESVLRRRNISEIFLARNEINPNVLRRIRKTADKFSVPIVLSQIHFRQIDSNASTVDPKGNIVFNRTQPTWSVRPEDIVEAKDL